MKEDKQQEARKLRVDGYSVKTIAKMLVVSKSSISLWVRDIPQPEKFTYEYRHSQKEIRLSRLKELREQRRSEKEISPEKLNNHLNSVKSSGRSLIKKSRILSGDGRWMVPAPPDYLGKTYIGNRYVYEHRLIMERKLGRLLEPDEVIHHLNGDKLDNREDNLQLLTRGVHTSGHAPTPEFVSFLCDYCGGQVSRRKNKYQKNKEHHFCNLSCSAKFQWRNNKK